MPFLTSTSLSLSMHLPRSFLAQRKRRNSGLDFVSLLQTKTLLHFIVVDYDWWWNCFHKQNESRFITMVMQATWWLTGRLTDERPKGIRHPILVANYFDPTQQQTRHQKDATDPTDMRRASNEHQRSCPKKRKKCCSEAGSNVVLVLE